MNQKIYFLIKNSTCFGQIYCSSSAVSTLYTQQQVFVMLVMLTVCQQGQDGNVYSVETPEDGQWICPKHVEFFIKNKFEKQCISLAFIIRIYYDARSTECQTVSSSLPLLSFMSKLQRQQHSLVCKKTHSAITQTTTLF